MTSTALDLNHHPATALAIEPGQPTWDKTQLAALAQLGLADAPAGDLSVFLHVSQRTRLDPFARQIYMIGRKEKKSEKRGGQWVDVWTVKYTIQTGIEGFRVIRGRAEHDEGIRGILGRPVYYDREGKEHKVWFQQQPPVAVEMTYTARDRNGNETPYTSVLRYSEYVQTRDDNGNRVPVAQWAVKPVHMLEKCTEADVYRKAFPQDFSGIYLDDAMPADTTPAGGTQDGRPRGRVTAGEVIGRGDPDGHEQKAPPRTARRGKAAGDAAQGQPQAGTETPRPDGEPGAHLPPPPGDEEPAEDQPGSVSQAQLTKLHAVLTGLGFNGDDREQKLVIAEVITRRAPLTGPKEGRTSGNLSLNEARKLIDTLDGFADRDALIAYMAEREQAGDSDG